MRIRIGNHLGRVLHAFVILGVGAAIAFFIPNVRFTGWLRPRRGPIYRFDPRADKLLGLFFPWRIKPAVEMAAFADRSGPPKFRNLDQVLAHYNRENQAARRSPRAFRIGHDNMESVWLCLTPWNGRAARLLSSENTPKIARLAAAVAASRPPFTSPVEKMLFQHDVYEMFCIYEEAVRYNKSPGLRRRGGAAVRALALLLRRTLFSASEIGQLRALRPRRVSERYFVPQCQFNLSDNYLPRRVLGHSPGWHVIPFITAPPAHFVYFQGRTFVHVYIRVLGWNRAKIWEYWRKLYRYAGDLPNQNSGDPPLPAKTQLLLVRTIGVFTRQFRFVDTGFPEEVLMRIFKYQRPRVDMATSDFRGTLFYQYELNRRRLLAHRRSLGLKRVQDTAPSFLGFTPEAPDLRNSHSSDISTMQYNCIGCHELQLYGAGTVFSLAHRPPTRAQLSGKYAYGGMLERTGSPHEYILHTRQFAELERILKADPGPAGSRAAGGGGR